jgi:hypothetical protein
MFLSFTVFEKGKRDPESLLKRRKVQGFLRWILGFIKSLDISLSSLFQKGKRDLESLLKRERSRDSCDGFLDS